MENGKQKISEKTDTFIRIYYTLASKDPVLLDAVKEAVEKLLERRRKSSKKKRPPTIAKIEHDEWALAPVA
jgi:hypothetical protein